MRLEGPFKFGELERVGLEEYVWMYQKEALKGTEQHLSLDQSRANMHSKCSCCAWYMYIWHGMVRRGH